MGTVGKPNNLVTIHVTTLSPHIATLECSQLTDSNVVVHRCPECDQFCRAGDDTFANHMVSAIAAKYMFRRQHHDTRDLMRVLKKLKGDFNNAGQRELLLTYC